MPDPIDHLHSAEGRQLTENFLIQKKSQGEEGYYVTARFKTSDGNYRAVRFGTQSKKLDEICRLAESLRQAALTMNDEQFGAFFAEGASLRNRAVSLSGGMSNLYGLVRTENGRERALVQHMDRDAALSTWTVDYDPVKTKTWFTVNMGRLSDEVPIHYALEWKKLVTGDWEDGFRKQAFSVLTTSLSAFMRWSKQVMPGAEQLGAVTTEKFVKNQAEFWTKALDPEKSAFDAGAWDIEVAAKFRDWQIESIQTTEQRPLYGVRKPDAKMPDSMPDLKAELQQLQKSTLERGKRLQALKKQKAPASEVDHLQQIQSLEMAHLIAIQQEIAALNMDEIINERSLPEYCKDQIAEGNQEAFLAAMNQIFEDPPTFIQRQHNAAQALRQGAADEIDAHQQMIQLAKVQNPDEKTKKDLLRLKATKPMLAERRAALVQINQQAILVGNALLDLPAGAPEREALNQELNRLQTATDEVVKTYDTETTTSVEKVQAAQRILQKNLASLAGSIARVERLTGEAERSEGRQHLGSLSTILGGTNEAADPNHQIKILDRGMQIEVMDDE